MDKIEIIEKVKQTLITAASTFSEDKKTLTVRTSTRKFNGNYGYEYYTLQ